MGFFSDKYSFERCHLQLNRGATQWARIFAIKSRGQWRPLFVTGNVPLGHTSDRANGPGFPRDLLEPRLEASVAARALHRETRGESPRTALRFNGKRPRCRK
jgi:hypothetical protein